ncbi:MAG: globin [Tumebacillaceae bacterium]
MVHNTQQSVYEMMGGAEVIRKLVDSFYAKVAQHPDLKPIFPDDLTETANKQYLFLTQFFGGPTLYSDKYGHPMLRARHMPFEITPTRAKAWLGCMKETLDELEMESFLRDFLLERFTQTAFHMVNTAE